MKNDGLTSFRKVSRGWYLGCRLLDAMKYGRWEDIQVIIKTRELDPNILVPEYGIAPIHCAAGIEPEDLGLKCIREFLKIGGNPNLKCLEGVTPVHVASCWGRLEVLETLLREGGNPYLIDNEGNDAFYYGQGKSKILRLLGSFDKVDNTLSSGRDEFIDVRNLKDKEELKAELLEEKYNEDLSLNSEAFSLMVKHRQNVIIFESFADDDSLSSTSLDQNSSENYDYCPLEDQSAVIVGNASSYIPVSNKTNLIESWINNNEIYSENLLQTDKTNIIKVLNEYVNKTVNKESVEDIKDTTEKETDAGKCNDGVHELNFSDNGEKNEFSDKTFEHDTTISRGNENLLYAITPSTNESVILKPIKSTSSCSAASFKKSNMAMKSDSEEMDFKTPFTSKEIERPSSVESGNISGNTSKFPEHIMDKLSYFKINTYYKSRTRVFKMISKSSETLKSKRSLYTTGFDFWSSKVKSKSYPFYSKPRKSVKNIIK